MTQTTKLNVKKRGPLCKALRCPHATDNEVSALHTCKGCPGPAFFCEYHECNTKCPFFSKGDVRCRLCIGASDEPSHQATSVVHLDALASTDKVESQTLDTADRPDDPIDDYANSADATLAQRDPTAGVRAERVNLPQEALEPVRKLLSFFVTLEVNEFALVRYLLNGGNLNTYAIVNNTRRQYVFEDMKRIMAKSPELRAIVKERKQPNGRLLHGHRGSAFQMDLF